jgi:ribosomal protein S12 methylthiotransferase accessory factor
VAEAAVRAQSTSPRDLVDLVQPWGGMFRDVSTFRSEGDEPRLNVRVADLGDLRPLWRESSFMRPSLESPTGLNGGGAGLSDSEGVTPALAEGLERYCTTVFAAEQFITATGQELGKDALDLDTIPRCSERELADPMCPLSFPTKRERIRWVKAVCLHSGKVYWVPAVLVYLYLKPISDAERIAIPITTGCAAHRTLNDALIGAMLELIERDSLSLTWLLKLGLPKVKILPIPSALQEDWDRYEDASVHLENTLFDATSDLGVPTIYGVQRSSFDRELTTVVACASALQPTQAIRKVMRDLVSTRMYLRHARKVPDRWIDFTQLPHGAAFMGREAQANAFDFLLDTTRSVYLEEMPPVLAATSTEALQLLLRRFRERQMRVYAVDLTSDEALRVGMRVVRVLVPELQPFAFTYRARYLGHSRLYSAPAEMGYPSLLEAELNAYPNPFA